MPGNPITLVAALGLSCLGCATPLNWERKASYVSAGVVQGFEHFDLEEAEDDSGSELDAHDTTGGELRIGHRFLPLAELELQGQLLDAFEIDEAGGGTTEIDLWTLGLNVKLYENLSERWFPELSERCLPYLLLGLGVMRAELDDPQTFLQEFDDAAMMGRAGLGLEAFVSERIAAYVEGTVVEPFSDLDGLTVFTLSAGLQWRF